MATSAMERTASPTPNDVAVASRPEKRYRTAVDVYVLKRLTVHSYPQTDDPVTQQEIVDVFTDLEDANAYIDNIVGTLADKDTQDQLDDWMTGDEKTVGLQLSSRVSNQRFSALGMEPPTTLRHVEVSRDDNVYVAVEE